MNFLASMGDQFSKDERSRLMSKIKSVWTSPERKIHNLLKGNKIRHKMHPKLPGNPDVYLTDYNTVVFIDGCFWHNCPIHGHIPKSNMEYWEKKIRRNVERDEAYTAHLRYVGYNVVRIWECEVSSRDFNFQVFIQNVKTAHNKFR